MSACGGGRFLSSAGTGKNCALSMRLPNSSPVLDKNLAPMGPEILSSTGARVWRKLPNAFSDSSSVLDKFQSASAWPRHACRFSVKNNSFVYALDIAMKMI